jgi:hypothetical protein
VAVVAKRNFDERFTQKHLDSRDDLLLIPIQHKMARVWNNRELSARDRFVDLNRVFNTNKVICVDLESIERFDADVDVS